MYNICTTILSIFWF